MTLRIVTCSNRSFILEVTKYLLRMSLKSLHSMRMCITVTETMPQQSQVHITEPLIGSQCSFIHLIGLLSPTLLCLLRLPQKRKLDKSQAQVVLQIKWRRMLQQTRDTRRSRHAFNAVPVFLVAVSTACRPSIVIHPVIRHRAESMNFASLPACSAAGYSNTFN